MEENKLELPTTSNGGLYSINFCGPDQKEILARVLMKLREWVELPSRIKTNHENHKFAPLRMTVSGEAGSGKSVLIHALVTVVRRMFGYKDSAIVVGPTGSSAFNAGGKTIHSFFGIRNSEKEDMGPSAKTHAALLKKLSHCVALIIDERSMVSSAVLGMAEIACRQTIFKGKNSNNQISWGGIPILLLVGDDYQLPPINSGAFDVLQSDKLSTKTRPIVLRGQQLFFEAGRDVMVLTSAKRTLPSQQRLQRILKGVRGEPTSTLSDEDIEYLCGFHLNQIHFKDEEKNKIEMNSLHLFATKEKMKEYNQQRLLKLHNRSNPVAKIKAQTRKLNGSKSKTASHYDDDRTPAAVSLCIGCRVEITGKNINPEWGLFNGSMGVVIDIVFAEGKSPNRGDLPLYVLVDFPLYRGPIFHPSQQTWVPITPVTTFCTRFKNCCMREFLPLKLSFGKTIHTFQGASVGPVSPGQPPNAIKSVICDPGTRTFEGINPGLFYTLLSRVTTLGTDEDRTSSAIFFMGNDMNKARIKNITMKDDGKTYQKVIKREKWVAFLNANTRKEKFDDQAKMDIFCWANETTVNEEELETIITVASTCMVPPN